MVVEHIPFGVVRIGVVQPVLLEAETLADTDIPDDNLAVAVVVGNYDTVVVAVAAAVGNYDTVVVAVAVVLGNTVVVEEEHNLALVQWQPCCTEITGVAIFVSIYIYIFCKFTKYFPLQSQRGLFCNTVLSL